MSSLELKVPPPAVALIFAVLMWLASSLLAPLGLPFGARLTLALVLGSLGLASGISAMVSFRRARTTMNPTRPTAAASLVTTGPFRLSRNPMYLSLLLYLLGWAVYLSNVLALLFLPAFVLYIIGSRSSPRSASCCLSLARRTLPTRDGFAGGYDARTRFRVDLSALRPGDDRAHAYGCLLVLPSMRGMPICPPSEGRRLLCVLFVRFGQVSADAGGAGRA